MLSGISFMINWTRLFKVVLKLSSLSYPLEMSLHSTLQTGENCWNQWHFRLDGLVPSSLKKEPKFRWFPAKWPLRNDCRISLLMRCHYPSSDWLRQICLIAGPIRNTTQIWVVTHHQYGISVLIPKTSLHGEAITGRVFRKSQWLVKFAGYFMWTCANFSLEITAV